MWNMNVSDTENSASAALELELCFNYVFIITIILTSDYSEYYIQIILKDIKIKLFLQAV